MTTKARVCLARSDADLLVKLIDGVQPEALETVLTHMTDRVVAELQPRVAEVPLEEQMDVLRSIYADGDPFAEVERRGDDFVLVEQNCPYLSAAMHRPELCSMTVSALRRLTGCEVVRERRVQDGDGRCEFRVRAGTQSPARAAVRFEAEPPRS